MMPPHTQEVAAIVGEPRRIGSEQRWSVRLRDGRTGVLAQLLPELAREPALRRRYVRDIERLRGLASNSLAPLVADGPVPDPRDPNAPAPWRLRADPPGEDLEHWLSAHAPAPPDRIAEVGAALCRALVPLHAQGMVVRDLQPGHIVLGPDGAVALTDVGLSRVDILSTRTAASLLLQGSPYASPEQLRRTGVDPRADLFALGVIAFRGLTGELPYGDGPALLRDDAQVPDVRTLRPDVPPELAAVIQACLQPNPDARPDSAADVARMLGGEGGSLAVVDRVACQHCGATLRLGQRICVNCGREAVKFRHTPDDRVGVSIDLVKVSEDADRLKWLREFLESIGEGNVPPLNFIVGSEKMYSEAEQARRIRLPYRLFHRVEPESAKEIVTQLEANGFGVRTQPIGAVKHVDISARGALVTFAILGILGASVMISMAAGFGFKGVLIGGMLAAVIGTAASIAVGNRGRSTGVIKGFSGLRLRAAPAALPASDPLVARIAALLGEETPQDVREQLGEIALWVQRFVDHRGRQGGTAAAELAMVTEPVEPLVGLLETETRRIAQLDASMVELDEGDLVRGLAAVEARGGTPTEQETLLDGLDKLRALEEQRAAAFARLLEISSLLRRSTLLGLRIEDEAAAHDRSIAAALGQLELEA